MIKVLITILLILPVNILVHELGHFITGKVLGYKLMFFRCYGITLYKIKGKLKVKWVGSPINYGQVGMLPKDTPLSPHYDLGGVYAQTIVLILLTPLLFIWSIPSAIITLVVTLLLIGTNLASTLPKAGGILTDGYFYSKLTLRDRQVLTDNTRIIASVSDVDYGDIDSSLCSLDKVCDNYIIQSQNRYFYIITQLITKKQYEQALEELQKLMKVLNTNLGLGVDILGDICSLKAKLGIALEESELKSIMENRKFNLNCARAYKLLYPDRKNSKIYYKLLSTRLYESDVNYENSWFV